MGVHIRDATGSAYTTSLSQPYPPPFNKLYFLPISSFFHVEWSTCLLINNVTDFCRLRRWVTQKGKAFEDPDNNSHAHHDISKELLTKHKI